MTESNSLFRGHETAPLIHKRMDRCELGLGSRSCAAIRPAASLSSPGIKRKIQEQIYIDKLSFLIDTACLKNTFSKQESSFMAGRARRRAGLRGRAGQVR